MGSLKKRRHSSAVDLSLSAFNFVFKTKCKVLTAFEKKTFNAPVVPFFHEMMRTNENQGDNEPFNGRTSRDSRAEIFQLTPRDTHANHQNRSSSTADALGYQ